jgi:hypothetical protein
MELVSLRAIAHGCYGVLLRSTYWLRRMISLAPDKYLRMSRDALMSWLQKVG